MGAVSGWRKRFTDHRMSGRPRIGGLSFRILRHPLRRSARRFCCGEPVSIHVNRKSPDANSAWNHARPTSPGDRPFWPAELRGHGSLPGVGSRPRVSRYANRTRSSAVELGSASSLVGGRLRLLDGERVVHQEQRLRGDGARCSASPVTTLGRPGRTLRAVSGRAVAERRQVDAAGMSSAVLVPVVGGVPTGGKRRPAAGSSSSERAARRLSIASRTHSASSRRRFARPNRRFSGSAAFAVGSRGLSAIGIDSARPHERASSCRPPVGARTAWRGGRAVRGDGVLAGGAEVVHACGRCRCRTASARPG